MNVLDSLYLLHDKSVHQIARKFFNSSEIQEDRAIEYDDIVQEVRCAWLKAIHTYSPEKGMLSTHFYNVANNYMIDFLRTTMKNQDKPILVDINEAKHLEAPDLIGDLEVNEAVVAALKSTLSAKKAEIVMLYFGINSEGGHSMTLQELADEFGVTKQYIHEVITQAIGNEEVKERLSKSFK